MNEFNQETLISNKEDIFDRFDKKFASSNSSTNLNKNLPNVETLFEMDVKTISNMGNVLKTLRVYK